MNYNDTNNFDDNSFGATDVIVASNKRSQLGLLSKIFGIVGLFCGPIFSILAIIFAIVCNKTGEGSGDAKVGIVTGIIGVSLYVLSVVALIIFYIVYFIVLYSSMM